MPPEVLAYYSMLTNQIVMYEDKQLGDAVPELAAKQACYTIAHEGVHQLLTNIGVQKRLAHWPAWICEGLPEYYCPLKVNSTLVHSTNSDLPVRTLKWTKAGMVNDIRMWSLLQMHEASGKALETLVESPQIDANGYALAWGLVHYLAKKKPAAFRDYLADISKYEPLDPANRPHVGQPDPLFVKHFGNDYAALEKDLQQYLTSPAMQKDYLDPIENQIHYLVKSVEKQGHGHAIKYAITTARRGKKVEGARRSHQQESQLLHHRLQNPRRSRTPSPKNAAALTGCVAWVAPPSAFHHRPSSQLFSFSPPSQNCQDGKPTPPAVRT